MRPMLFPSASVNHTFPSTPAAIPAGNEFAVGIENSVMTPDGVIRPILFATLSANQRLPSGPRVSEAGPAAAVGARYFCTAGAGVEPDSRYENVSAANPVGVML